MSIPDIFSRRNNPKNIGLYEYSKIPEGLKIQVMYIAEDLLGDGLSIIRDRLSRNSSSSKWHDFRKFILREWAIPENKTVSAIVQIRSLILSKDFTVPHFLDFCEMLLIKTSETGKEVFQRKTKFESIEELNFRFLNSAFGYQYVNGKMIRIDNQLIHKEIIIPALNFLSNPLFEKSDSDYRLAHEHYRENKIKDCIIACGRSFESIMKAICDDKKWSYPAGSRASDLIKALRTNGLFRDGADRGFDTYIAMLKTGLPDLRNAIGGHGETPDAPEPALYMASYALHLTATNLLFLANSWEALP